MYLFPDEHGDLRSLSDQLTGVELGHDALQDLVTDRRKNWKQVILENRPIKDQRILIRYKFNKVPQQCQGELVSPFYNFKDSYGSNSKWRVMMEKE